MTLSRTMTRIVEYPNTCRFYRQAVFQESDGSGWLLELFNIGTRSITIDVLHGEMIPAGERHPRIAIRRDLADLASRERYWTISVPLAGPADPVRLYLDTDDLGEHVDAAWDAITADPASFLARKTGRIVTDLPFDLPASVVV